MIEREEFFALERKEQLEILLNEMKETGVNPEYIMEELYFDENGLFYNNIAADTEEELSEKESFVTKIKYSNLKTQDFSENGLCMLHKEIFGDIYDWAGQTRMMDIVKTEKQEDYIYESEYCAWYTIEPLNNNGVLKDSIEKMINDEYSCSDKEKVDKLTYHFNSLWNIHPFMDGNTRTTFKFVMDFAENIDIHFDLHKVEEFELRNLHKMLANANSSIQELSEEYIEKVFDIMYRATDVRDEIELEKEIFL